MGLCIHSPRELLCGLQHVTNTAAVNVFVRVLYVCPRVLLSTYLEVGLVALGMCIFNFMHIVKLLFKVVLNLSTISNIGVPVFHVLTDP